MLRNRLLISAIFFVVISNSVSGLSQQPQYSTKPFKVPDAYGDSIPVGYRGNSLKAVWDAQLNRVSSFKDKGEYETQEEFLLRFKKHQETPIIGQLLDSSNMAFVLPKVTTKYDIDLQVLFVVIGCTDYAYKDSDLDFDRVALTLAGNISSNKKTGKTRMGMPIHYVESTGSSYSIILPRSENIAPGKNIVIGIQMPPEESIQVRNNLKVLLVGKFNKIEAAKETHTASLDEPYEDAILHKYLLLNEPQFIVFNFISGKTYEPKVDPL